ncbi:MAG TPA: hypothetical protein VJW94_18200 [Candidatus Acidoferrum sp.]|nr:hypothetical protein [Candidatus Acidoferrum sp.]
MNIIETMSDPALFGGTFSKRTSWGAWKSCLSAVFGLEMSDAALEIYRQCTGRSSTPSSAFSEAWLICGRRSGKSQIAALVGVYLSCFRDHRLYRAPGETLVLPIISPDRKQGQVILNYIDGLLDSTAMLRAMVVNRLKESIELKNGIEIRVATASFRTIRGYTAISAIVDEAAFLRSDDSTTPDSELIAALLPAMSTVPGAILLAISSPYSRRGEVWKAYKAHYAKNDSPVLCWVAPTTTMNPSVSRVVIAAAYLRDAQAAKSEFGAQFRSDLESFVPIEVVEACVVKNRRELPPSSDVHYYGFVDPSGGSSDSFTLSICHAQKDKVVLDAVRETVPPFSPETVAADYAMLLKAYNVRAVVGDAYGGEWPREQFRKHRIEYRVSEKNRSELYLETLPLLTAGRAELLDHPKLIAQFCSLERRTGRSGRDSVDHPPHSHDDLANVVAGGLVQAAPTTSHVLGVVEYGKAVQSGAYPMPAPPPPRPIVSSDKPGLTLREQPKDKEMFLGPVDGACPFCRAVCIAKVGGRWRCGTCGEMFGPVVVGARLTRKDVLH